MYLQDGIGLSGVNLEVLQAFGEHVSSHGLPVICGGDFNLSPEILSENTPIRSLGLVPWHDPNRFSCTSGDSHSTIDFFLVSRAFCDVMDPLARF